MKRSHPPTLIKVAERTVLDEHLFGPGDVVVAAVSGGPDSIALLHVLAKIVPGCGARLFAHGVDHGLRSSAAAELELGRHLASQLGVPFTTTRIEVKPGPNLMARARDARYDALQTVLRTLARSERAEPHGRYLIATGHHADDRAETVLIRLLRGTGPAGLAVLPPRTTNLIRPFIRARRADVMAHVERHRLAYAHDPTNRDPRFLRTRVRHEVLPLLAELSPRIVEHLCDLADSAVEREMGETHLVPAVIEGHSLGRAHRAALARALKSRNPRARVPLPGGKIAGVDLSSRRIVLMKPK
jgi:tRNA(Ile)-lysidine synthase